MNASRDWLVPIGDTGFYVTPNEPVEPWDCARWSGSPICSDPVSIDPEIVYNPGNFNLTPVFVDPESLAPDIFGISTSDLVSFTPVTIADPEFSFNECEACVTFGGTFWFVPIPESTVCRRRPECINPPPPPPPPGPPPGGPGGSGFTPVSRPNDNPNCLYHFYRRIPPYVGEEWAVNGDGFIQGQAIGVISVITYSFQTDTYSPTTGYVAPLENIGLSPYVVNYVSSYLVYVDPDGETVQRLMGWVQTPVISQRADGSWGFSNIQNFEIAAIVPFTRQEMLAIYPSLTEKEQTALRGCLGLPPPSPPLPPPRVPPRECCMCCESNDNEELLRLIARRLGVNAYPVEVPKSLIDGVGSGSQSLQSITELSVWQMLQMDGLLGQFPINIKIKDADLTQAGNQEKTIRLYNIAEALAELYAVSVKTSVVGDAQTQMLARLAAEAVATHAGVAVNQDYVSAIASYLGFASSTPPRKLKFAFDLTEPDSLDKLMKTVDKEVIGFQDDDKNTVQDYLEKLMFAAGIIKSVYYRKPSQVSEMLSQMQSIFSTQGSAAENEAWKQFLTQLNQPEPGRPQNSAPKISDRTLGQEDQNGA